MATMARSEAFAHSGNPAHQAYLILHFAFTVAPILTGLDKFFDLLAEWGMYLGPLVPRVTGLAPQTFMRTAGVVEIAAGLIVAFRPRIGAWVVAAWLWGIIINLLLIPGFFDIALRDFGLSLGAVALARLASEFGPAHAGGRQ
jgi:hypothetical protein